jgi:hypothetical protein
MKQNKIFQQQQVNMPRMSAFDLSREQKLSCKLGELVPTYLEEVLPGDQFRVKTESLVRFAPMLAPMMHRVDVFMHYFFIPNRLIWTDWERFISGDRDGKYDATSALASTVETAPVFPTVNANGSTFSVDPSAKKLADYLGLPVQNIGTSLTPAFPVSQLPFRAYQQVYNDYYRDSNLEEEVDITSYTSYLTLRYRKWEKDYFTSALPFVQRGTAAGVPIDIDYAAQSRLIRFNDATPTTGTLSAGSTMTGGGRSVLDSSNQPLRIENLEATLDFQINELRKASALQRWLEKQALGGYRYIETIYSHFGVKSSDRRLQRAEYLGGGKTPVLVSEVLNTSATTDPNDSKYMPQGSMTGHGISAGETMAFQTQIEEHGYIMGIMSIMPKPAYHQGVHKHWLRNDKFDYFWPELANLGEQEVKDVELYVDDNAVTNDSTFGYQQRYAEYKYGQSTIHGDFRTGLHYWHMARKFSSAPSLNDDFVECTPDADSISNVFAVEDASVDTCWVQLYHDVKARRPMPYFANPSLI